MPSAPGIADDKAVYTYMPEIIRFYHRRGADPQERADLALPRGEDALAYVLDNLPELVVKEVNGSGGYGMLVGPHADEGARSRSSAQAQARSRRLHRPADAGALDLPDLRRAPASRRATSICAPSCSAAPTDIRIVPGGLTRVALKEGSLVVNSSQGGGTKDTWVLEG
jgi:uncharacterized circularly permuted ATP-grasp superfamily protein